MMLSRGDVVLLPSLAGEGGDGGRRTHGLALTLPAERERDLFVCPSPYPPRRERNFFARCLSRVLRMQGREPLR